MSLKDEQKKSITVFTRLSIDENKQIEFLANKYGTTKTGVVRTAIRELIERENTHPQVLKTKISIDLKNILFALGLKQDEIDILLQTFEKE